MRVPPRAALPRPDYTAAVTAPPAPEDDDRLPAAGGLDEGALAQVLGYQLAQANVHAGRAFARSIGTPLELRPVEFSLLMLLQANEGSAPKQLAGALALSAPHLTVLLDRMEERGLLARTDSTQDRRTREVRLTPQGQALAARAAEAARTMEQALLQRLTPGEGALLFELLRKLCGRPRC